MERDVARHVIRVAFRTAAELQEFMSLLKQQCSAEEYKDYALGIAAAIDSISVALTNKVLSSHPELTDEIESRLTKFGRYI